VTTTDRSRVIRFAEADEAIPGPAGERALTFLRRGTVEVKLSRPLPPNHQAPHTQDELYVIARGRGVIVHDGRRDTVEAGDCIFIAAGTEHRFESFSEDLAVWVVFYGVSGGEVPPGR
jgi:mannose-6-phosphate isomerase-like protein (cupin superfamily)